MFDLNQILSAALNAAVAEAVAPLVERIAVLERRIDTLSSQHVAIGERLAALENNPAQGQDLTPTTGLTRDQVEALIEQAMEEHTSSYDHDDYDRHISDDDKHIEGDLDDAVREAVSNLSFEVSVS